MSAPYQQSYGDDSYFDDEDRPLYLPARVVDDYEDIFEDFPDYRPQYFMEYNKRTQMWECSCPVWKRNGSCPHSYRFRREVVLKVNSRYL